MQLIQGIIFLAVGSCVPWGLLWGFAATFVDISHRLVITAAGNAQIDGIVALIVAARTELRMLAAKYRDGADPRTLQGLEDQDRLMEMVGVMERLRARFFGFVVGFDTVRTFLVSVFALAVGLFSVLRGIGAFTTLEGACPVRS